MRLKKLQVMGFKSFAEKTTLTFEAGITAIVGPNGCGKSNIADAIRWVLGEQSAKSMRGNRMPDVIFAGTSNRKPLNFAEVAMTLTDVQGALPIEYEEITVLRRLHRSGESEYFLNQQPIRLKDLQNLFLDSGIGKNSYSIFEQGKIEQVIHFTPLERRYIFEEAAGILRFLQRKRETLRKLEQTDQNVARVKDIHREVEKQVMILREQSAKAQIYKELKEKLDALEKGLLVAKRKQIEKKRLEALQQEEVKLQEILAISTQVAEYEEQRSLAKSQLDAAEKSLKVQSEELYQIRSDKEIKNREKQNTLGWLKESQVKQKRWQHELEEVLTQREFREIELVRAKKQLQAAESDNTVLEASLQEQRMKVATLESEVAALYQEQRRQQQAQLNSLQVENQLESDLKQINVRLEGFIERQTHLLSRAERLAVLDKELEEQVAEKQKVMQESSNSIDHQRNLLQSLEQKIEETIGQIDTLKALSESSMKAFNEIKARYNALSRLQSDLEGFSVASKRLLQESQNPKSCLHGLLKGLYEMISPKKGAEEAVASVLNKYSQTLVVESVKDAKTVIAFAEREKLIDFSLIILELIQGKTIVKRVPSPSLTPLLTQVESSILSNHLLNEIFLSDTSDQIESVTQNESFEVWCNDYTFVDRKGVHFYGKQAVNNAFLREAEIKMMDLELQKLEASKQQHENALKIEQQKRSELHLEMVELDKNIRRHEMALVEVNFGLQRLNGDLERNKKEATQSEIELNSLRENIELQRALLIEMTERHQVAKENTLQLKAQMSTFEADLLQKNGFLQEQKAFLHEVDSSCSGAAKLLQKHKHDIHILEIQESESLRQEGRLEEELHLAAESQVQLSRKNQEWEQALEKIELILQAAIKAHQVLDEGLQAKKDLIVELEKEMSEILQKGKKQEQEQHQFALLIAQLDAASKGIEDDLQERHGLSLAEAEQLPPPIEKSVDAMERKLREWRREMEGAGDINMTSIEECAKHQVRYEFLNQQIEDLTGSKDGLMEIIRNLDVESRKLFKETFATICANFKKNFVILFNGGEADLQFTESSDLLEAGIEIIAKPPGKQMRSISLLSGGEKCLTALALLFAIFEVKAGPFCILDEIDAPLDDSNVDRFANIVKQFVNRCQFIIITHNKQTMEIADTLFGVTMEEKGVSKLLQMELYQECNKV